MKIHEAARHVGVASATLRKWERMRLLQPLRTASGYRDFDAEQIRRARQIRSLSQRGFPLAAIRDLIGSPVPTVRPQPVPELGPALKQLRLNKRLGLTQAARLAEISPSHLSQLESARAAPSIALLQRLGTVYDVTLLDFVPMARDTPPARLVRRTQRPSLPVRGERVVVEALAQGDTAIEALHITVQPGGGCLDAHRHDGGEFLFVQGGTLEVVIDEQDTHILQAGDSLAFASSHLHRWQALGLEPAHIVWVHTRTSPPAEV